MYDFTMTQREPKSLVTVVVMHEAASSPFVAKDSTHLKSLLVLQSMYSAILIFLNIHLLLRAINHSSLFFIENKKDLKIILFLLLCCCFFKLI